MRDCFSWRGMQAPADSRMFSLYRLEGCKREETVESNSFAQATTSSYACRPYISGANETCDLDIPLGQNKAYIMVRGYRNGKYHLVLLTVFLKPP